MSFQVANAKAPLPPSVLDSLCEFLSAAFHSLLHTRGVYPPHLFTAAQMYLLAVQVCRSPPVISYIQSVVGSLKESLGNRTVDAVMLVLFHPKNPAVPLEAFSFKIANVRAPVVDPKKEGTTGEDDSITAIEAHFRGVLTKLASCKAPTFKFPPNEYPTFRIVAHAVSTGPIAGPAHRDDHNIAPLGNDWLPATNVTDVPDLSDDTMMQYGLSKRIDPIYTFKSRGLIISTMHTTYTSGD